MSQVPMARPEFPSLRSARALSRLSDDTTLASAGVRARAEVQATVASGVAAIAVTAMQDIALLSQMEQSLAQAVPHASGRLATIADITANALAGIVANSAHRIQP